MEVSCFINFIVSVVGLKKGADSEGFLRASVNSRTALFAVYAADRVGIFELSRKNSTLSLMHPAAVLVTYTVHQRWWYGACPTYHPLVPCGIHYPCFCDLS